MVCVPLERGRRAERVHQVVSGWKGEAAGVGRRRPEARMAFGWPGALLPRARRWLVGSISEHHPDARHRRARAAVHGSGRPDLRHAGGSVVRSGTRWTAIRDAGPDCRCAATRNRDPELELVVVPSVIALAGQPLGTGPRRPRILGLSLRGKVYDGCSSPRRRSRNRRSGSCLASSSALAYDARASSTRPSRRQRSARAECAKW